MVLPQERRIHDQLQVSLMKLGLALIALGALFASVPQGSAGEPLKGDVTTTEPKKVEYPRQNWPDSTAQGGSPAPIPASSTVPIPDPCVSKPDLCK